MGGIVGISSLDFLEDDSVFGDFGEIDLDSAVGAEIDFMFEAIEAGFADVVLVHAEHHRAAIGLVVVDITDLADELLFMYGGLSLCGLLCELSFGLAATHDKNISVGV